MMNQLPDDLVSPHSWNRVLRNDLPRVLRETCAWVQKSARRKIVAGAVLAFLVLASSFWGLQLNRRAHASEIFAAIRYQEEDNALELIAKYPKCVNSASFDGRLDVDKTRRTRGWTMLHLAALTCQPRIVGALIRNGASVNATVRGVTPLDAIIGISPAKPSFLDIMQLRDGYDGKMLAVARMLYAHGAKGEHFERLTMAWSEAYESTAVQNMNAIISGLGG